MEKVNIKRAVILGIVCLFLCLFGVRFIDVTYGLINKKSMSVAYGDEANEKMENNEGIIIVSGEKTFTIDLSEEVLGGDYPSISVDAEVLMYINRDKEEGAADAMAIIGITHDSGAVSSKVVPVKITKSFKPIEVASNTGLCGQGRGEHACWHGHVPQLDVLFYQEGEAMGEWNFRTEFYTKMYYASFVYECNNNKYTVSNIEPGTHIFPAAVYVTGKYVNFWS